jgi:DNA polymerase-3 subunit beta
VVITPFDSILNQLILVIPIQLIGNNSTTMEEDTRDDKEVIIIENISSGTQVNEEINIAAKAGNMEEVVKEANNLINTNYSRQKTQQKVKLILKLLQILLPKLGGEKRKLLLHRLTE